jgi:hypothetical protein
MNAPIRLQSTRSATCDLPSSVYRSWSPATTDKAEGDSPAVQWPAVTTQYAVRTAPPHIWRAVHPDSSWSDTCHGNSPANIHRALISVVRTATEQCGLYVYTMYPGNERAAPSASDVHRYVSIVKLVFFLVSSGGGWDWVHLVLRSLTALFYRPRMIDNDEYRAVAGTRTCRGNRSTRRKSAPVHFVHHKSHMTWPGL